MDGPRPPTVGGLSFAPSEILRIRAQLEKLLLAPAFLASERRTRLLRHLVEQTLEGKGEQITEYGIGLDIFDRPPSFDPRLESIVRTEASRLRQKLKEYYSTGGLADSVHIEIPQRSYVPVITFRDPVTLQEPPKAVPQTFPQAPGRSRVRLSIVAVIALAAITILAWVDLRSGWTFESVANPPVGSLVVLPFQNLSADPQNQYLADGLTEELTNQLAQWSDLRVVARTSAAQFKGKGVDVREIGRVLNVAAVLEGSFERDGDRIRVTAQLNRSSNGYHVWSKSFETRSRDMMALQEEMAKAIASAVRGAHAAPAPRSADSTADPDAHDLYLRANYQLSLRTPVSLRNSLALFQQAVGRDPSYVAAYKGIARAELALVHFTAEGPGPGHARAREAIEKALKLDPNDAESLGQVASLDYMYDWNWPRAEREFQQALERGGQAATRSSYGWSLATRGRFAEAHRQFRIAQDVDPLNEGPRVNEVMAYYLGRDYGGAKRILNELINSKMGELDGHLLLGLIAIVEHDCDLASGHSEWNSRAFPAPMTTFGRALVAGCRGGITESHRLLAEAEQGRGKTVVSPYQLALGYAYLGDRDTALKFLEKSAEEKEGQILYLKYEPIFDAMRSDPRFVAMERKVGLMQ